MKTLTYLFVALFSFSNMALIAQAVDTESSSVHWLGKKIGGQHEGYINIESGQLNVKDGQITDGYFVIDMTSITNTDLEDEAYNAKLVGHLKSDDFFGVETYPTATLKITKAGAFKNGKATVNADLNIKGKTEAIRFDVTQESKGYTATVDIDRSKFDVRYGSNSFFDNLGDKAIDDIFTLDIAVVTE